MTKAELLFNIKEINATAKKTLRDVNGSKRATNYYITMTLLNRAVDALTRIESLSEAIVSDAAASTKKEATSNG